MRHRSSHPASKGARSLEQGTHQAERPKARWRELAGQAPDSSSGLNSTQCPCLRTPIARVVASGGPSLLPRPWVCDIGDAFDASLAHSVQPNAGTRHTRGNTPSGDVEYAARSKSYATMRPGCTFNPLTGRGQPPMHLFDNGSYLPNASVKNVPLTQLSSLKRSTPVFLAANAGISTDHFVRDDGTGTRTRP